MLNTYRLLLLNAIQVGPGPDEKLRTGDGKRREGMTIVELIRGQHLECRTGRQDGGDPILVRDVELAVGQKGRGADDSLRGALRAPDQLAGPGVQARLRPI